jgi:O-antigen/teichoic acid export membrane protein
VLAKFLKAGFGGVGAQAVNLLALPIISRLYAPEEYAVWALVMATAGIVGGIACFRYELAIVIPPDEEEASSLFWWCIISSIGMGMIVAGGTLALYLPGMPLATVGKHSALYTFYAPLLIVAMGITLALQYWTVRQESFSINSFSQIGMAGATLAVQVGYAVAYDGQASGLLAGSLIGQLVAVVVLGLGNAQTKTVPAISRHILSKIPQALKSHNKFFKYSTPYSLFGTVRARASVYVLAMFLSPRDIGLYAFAYRVLNFPVSLISSALRPVIFQETASKGTAALEHKLNRILKWLAILATPFVVIYFFYAKELFVLFFGQKWAGAEYYGNFFMLPVFTFLFCNWMDRIMDVMGQQRLTMILEIVFSVLSIAGLWSGLFFGLGLFGALLIQCLVLIVYNLMYLVVAYDRAGYSKAALFRLAVMVIGIASFSIISVYIARLNFA